MRSSRNRIAYFSPSNPPGKGEHREVSCKSAVCVYRCLCWESYRPCTRSELECASEQYQHCFSSRRRFWASGHLYCCQNGQVYGAETINGGYIMVVTNHGSGTTFSNLSILVLANYGTNNQTYAQAGSTSPALTSNTATNTLYLAYTDVYGINHIISSTDGVHWTGPQASSSSPNGLPTSTQDNPSLAIDQSTGTVYAGYTSGQYYTPIVCSWVPGTNATCNQYYSLDTANFSPGIVFWNGLVYFGYEHRGDSHCLFFYKYNPNNTSMTQWQPNGCGEQTSAGPSLAVFNNELYVAFRTNDSSAKFTLRVSTDGGNTLSYRQQPGFTMDGYPSIVNTNGTGDGNALMNVYPRYNAVYATIGR